MNIPDDYNKKMKLAFTILNLSQKDIVNYFKKTYNFDLNPTYITHFTQTPDPEKKQEQSKEFNLSIRDRIYECMGLELYDFHLPLKEFTELLIEKQ
jgi:hypothetical protein